MYCHQCGTPRSAPTGPCGHCGASAPNPGSSRLPGADKKIAAGICGILLGSLGVHKFILGYTGAGLLLLLATVCTCGIAAPITGVIGLVEGIVYLTKTDEEFVETYLRNERQWF